jgi:hypothetical protein
VLQLTADDALLLKDLALFVEPVEISDATGKLLGLFVPANLERGKQLYAAAAARLDHAELDRRRQSPEPGLTHAEMMAHLEALQAECQRRRAAGLGDLTPDEAAEFVRGLREPANGEQQPAEKHGCATP